MIRSSLSPAKVDHHVGQTFAANVVSKPSGMRDRAMQLVELFGGECLSDKKLSIVKGAEAFKFKCTNGHIFYKFVAELQKMRPLQCRKMSKTTAASSSSSASISSDDDTPITTDPTSDGCWCPKCESFYKGAQIIAKSCGFRLCGDLYAKKLELKCLKAKHVTPISSQKRIQANLKCASCRKNEREAVKERLREEERIQDAYYTAMQEKMFAEARREMEKEIADAGLGSGYNGSFGQQSSSYFMDEAQRRQLMEQRINKTAEALTT